jgi:hypothetical protein
VHWFIAKRYTLAIIIPLLSIIAFTKRPAAFCSGRGPISVSQAIDIARNDVRERLPTAILDSSCCYVDVKIQNWFDYVLSNGEFVDHFEAGVYFHLLGSKYRDNSTYLISSCGSITE